MKDENDQFLESDDHKRRVKDRIKSLLSDIKKMSRSDKQLSNRYAQWYTVFMLANLLRCLSKDLTKPYTHLTKFMDVISKARDARNGGRHRSTLKPCPGNNSMSVESTLQKNSLSLLTLYQSGDADSGIAEICKHLDA
tara:strand:- start:118 stop:531 length:414 start_codon:yes stop_codon:yes gene_type:complete